MKGLGLREDGEGIDYRERSPLVLPPGKDLPPPEANATAKKGRRLAGRSGPQAREEEERGRAQAQAHPARRRRQAAAAEPDDRPKVGTRNARRSAGDVRTRARQRRAQHERRTRLQGHFRAMLRRALGAEGRVRALHRRAAARQPDRAAAPGTARRRPRSLMASAKTSGPPTVVDKQRDRQIITAADRTVDFDGLRPYHGSA